MLFLRQFVILHPFLVLLSFIPNTNTLLYRSTDAAQTQLFIRLLTSRCTALYNSCFSVHYLLLYGQLKSVSNISYVPLCY